MKIHRLYTDEKGESHSDGDARIIGAGEVILVEDTTGKGHLSKAVNERLRHCIYVTLD